MAKASSTPINTLLRGIAANDLPLTAEAWRALVAAGEDAVPVVRRKLASPAWGVRPRGPAARYLGMLLLLLDELDPLEFAEEIRRLTALPLHPAHSRTVEIIGRRATEPPSAEVGPGLPLYIAPGVEDAADIAAAIGRWCETPGLDLAGAARIDVIGRDAGMYYLGFFAPLLSGVVLTWPSDRAIGLAGSWRRLRMERAFYRAVGLRAPGPDATAAAHRDRAEAHAALVFRTAHPVLAGVLQAASLPFRLARPALRRRAALAAARRHTAWPGAAE